MSEHRVARRRGANQSQLDEALRGLYKAAQGAIAALPAGSARERLLAALGRVREASQPQAPAGLRGMSTSDVMMVCGPGSTGAPRAANGRRVGAKPTAEEWAASGRVLGAYNAVLGRRLAATPGNVGAVCKALRAGYTEGQLITAVVVAQHGPDDWYRQARQRTDLDILLRFQGGHNQLTGHEAKRHLDHLLGQAPMTKIEIADQDAPTLQALDVARCYGVLLDSRPWRRVERSAEEEWWNRLDAIAPKVNFHSFATWFRPTEGLARGDDGRVIVGVPSQQFVEWITTNYSELLKGFTLVPVERRGDEWRSLTVQDAQP